MATSKLTINAVNLLARNEFENLFGNIVEHYPKTASYIFEKLPLASLDEFCNCVAEYLEKLSLSEKEAILKLHPDLAGKLADLGKLTSESSQEQESAGLHLMADEDKVKMTNLNNAYKTKFGFPFVICARENKIPAILNGIQVRLRNSLEVELKTGIDEVKKISKLRILQIVD